MDEGFALGIIPKHSQGMLLDVTHAAVPASAHARHDPYGLTNRLPFPNMSMPGVLVLGGEDCSGLL